MTSMEKQQIVQKEKPKKLRRRHIKKAIVVTVYAFVAIVTVMSMVAPALQ